MFDIPAFWTLLNKKYKEGQIGNALKHLDKITREEVEEKYYDIFSNEIEEE